LKPFASRVRRERNLPGFNRRWWGNSRVAPNRGGREWSVIDGLLDADVAVSPRLRLTSRRGRKSLLERAACGHKSLAGTKRDDRPQDLRVSPFAAPRPPERCGDESIIPGGPLRRKDHRLCAGGDGRSERTVRDFLNPLAANENQLILRAYRLSVNQRSRANHRRGRPASLLRLRRDSCAKHGRAEGSPKRFIPAPFRFLVVLWCAVLKRATLHEASEFGYKP